MYSWHLNRLQRIYVKRTWEERALTSWAADSASHDEDSDLVERAGRGDRAAFEKLYRRHRDRVYGLLWRLAGGDAALAEDLLQEAFVRAWQKLDSFRGESRFGTWLHRLSANVALSDRRIRLKRVQRETALDEGAERTAMGDRDVRAGQQMDLERAIAALPERARTVLVLYDIEGYSHAEIAELTDMAVGSSKAQLHRARKLIREDLEK
ncbi:MAG: sigma-70 family RNA polymerase sigma factor [Xanthomonadales bacterium]|jgi:RNA polymerase sigma-70 factor (ECF subfamily)|nr:sigma-70 family RNA polymerase sigma factor [Xanthomonadales bacterium]